MANEKVSQLPTVANATLQDVIYAIQGGVSVQETLQQVYNITSQNIIQHFNGNPNGNVAGTTYTLCWDTATNVMYVCTTTGSAVTAVWTVIPPGSGITSPASGGTGVANPTAHGVAVAEGASNFNFLTLTNGQVLIGSTGADPVPGTLTAGTNINIANTAGGVTISASGAGGFSWTHVTGATQAMVSNNGYVADRSSLITFTLPPSSVLGDELTIVGRGTGGWTLVENSGQYIFLGSSQTTTTTGSLSSTNGHDCITLVCTLANIEWTVYNLIGNITVV